MNTTSDSLIMQCMPYIQRIATELISLTPESWKSFYVAAEVTSDPQSLESVKVIIRSNEGYEDVVFPSDELTTLIFKILDEFRDHFRIRFFKCNAFQKYSGGWGYKTDFEYFDPLKKEDLSG